LDPYETLILVFEQVVVSGYTSVSGSAGDDLLFSIGVPSYYFGGSGNDTVSYAESLTGIFASLGTTPFSMEIGTGDLFDSVENVIGSSFDDVIIGDETVNTLLGGNGRDHLLGGEGSDTLEGGDGDDTLDGGAGNDFVRGGVGNDVILVSSGQDTVDGGAGIDEISFIGSVSGVSIWTLDGVAETRDGLVHFSQIEVFAGSGFSDVISGGLTSRRYFGNDGDDQIRVFAFGDYVDAGAGDDFVVAMGYSSTIFLGEGDDELFMYDSGTVVAGGGDDFIFLVGGFCHVEGGEGNDVIHSGLGNDVFVFSQNSGNDEIFSFDPTHDEIQLESIDPLGVSLQNGDDGTSISFSDGSSVFCHGVDLVFEDLVFL
jgi:Ca2+-binding RTX toxin-like protein